MTHSTQCPVNVSSNYAGHPSAFATQNIKGRQKGNKVGSPAVEGTLNKETRDVASTVNSARHSLCWMALGRPTQCLGLTFPCQ